MLGVVDRGDRRRQRVVSLASADVQRLIEAARVAGSAHRFGVGQIFDRYETLAQIGANRDEVARATTAMRADGAIGDSGRLLIEAIRQLSPSPRRSGASCSSPPTASRRTAPTAARTSSRRRATAR